MSIERLRALEKKWRDESVSGFNGDGNLSDTWTAQAMRSCADELAAIIAELGQEVGAVASRPLHKVEPSDDEPQFRTLSNEVAPQVYFYRLGWNQCRDAMLLTSPAHTSVARDAGLLDALREIYEWEPYDAMSYGARRLAAQALNDYDAAMRQEAE